MADGEIRIKLNADGAGIVATLRKIGLLEGEVGKGGKAAGAAMEEAWKGVITEGVLAARQTEKLRAELDRLRERTGGGFLGHGWASFVTGLNQARELIGSIVSGAMQVGSALYEHAIKPAMELEDALVRVAALSGGGEGGRAAAGRLDAVANAWQDFSTQGNNEFSARVERAMRAGMDMEAAMRAVQSAFVAAQGNQETADALLQKVLEVEASGQLTERAIKFFERQGLDLRAALAEQFGATREEVSGLLKDGSVGVEDLLGALQRLTGEGTRAWTSFQESLGTASAAVRRAENDWSDALKGMGTELLPVVVEAMQKASAAIREMGPDLREVGRLLTDVVLSAVEGVVSLLAQAADLWRELTWNTEGEIKNERDREQERRRREFEENARAQKAALARMAVDETPARVADTETAQARAERQAAERAARESARLSEEADRNLWRSIEEGERRRHDWLMHYGRLSDVESGADLNSQKLDLARQQLDLDKRISGGLLSDAVMKDLDRIQQLEERATALEKRQTDILSKRLAAIAHGRIMEEAARLPQTRITGFQTTMTRSSLSQVGGGGNAFMSLQSVQLQQERQQTATLKQLEDVSRQILRLMPRNLASAILS